MVRRTLALGFATTWLTASQVASAVTNCGTDCYQADSCQSADVQAAIDAATAASGGTVRIPDPTGTSCDWTETVKVDASKVPLEITGQSQDTTHIRASTQAFEVSGGAGVLVQLSKLKLSDAACTASCDALVSVGAESWRIHHLRFETNGEFTRLFRSYGKTSGLIDHIVVRGGTPSEFVTVDDENFVGWKRPAALGSAEAVYVEDCDIAFTDSWEGRPFDGENGGRMVVRHNVVKNQMLGSHGLDSGFGASIFSVVAYANAFTFDDDTPAWSSKTWARLTHFRGGTGLIYGNTWTIGADIWIGTPTLDLAIYRTPGDAGGNEHWQACNGTQYRMCSNIDKDWTLASGNYPYNCATDQDCVDKIGAGTTCKWKFCSKSKLELCTTDTDCPGGETCTAYLDGDAADGYPCFMQIGYGTQMERDPWYEWGNTWTGGEGGSACASPPCDVDFGEDVSQLEPGRDYFDDVNQGTTLPSSCSPYDAYFNTAEKTLYRCDAAGAWQAFYQEYTYPHPLQGGGGAGGSGGGGGASGAGATGAGGSSAAGGAGGGGAGSGGTKASSGGDDSGCGCATPGRKPGAALSFLMLMAALGASLRRARGRR